MSSLRQLRTTPPYDPLWKLATIINKLIGGASNSVGSVTLAQNLTTTTLSDTNIKRGSKVFFSLPKTAHAATVTGLWADPTTVPEKGGMITLTHSAVNQADLNFDYEVRS